MAKPLSAILLLALLVSCASPATEPPPASPLPRLATTPALEPWVSQWVAAYRLEHGSLGFEVEVLPPAAALEAVEEGEVALLVAGIGAPDGWFATPLGFEGIAVLVHADNSVRSFSLSELDALFGGRMRSWTDLGGAEGGVQPVIPLAGDEVRLRFETVVMGGVSSTSYSLLAPSPAAMLSMIASDPLSIGYVPLSLNAGEAWIARLEGVLPGETTLADGTYPLLLEVIAMAPTEPQGVLRDWLAWVQASTISGLP